jgi:hypothetical protein
VAIGNNIRWRILMKIIRVMGIFMVILAALVISVPVAADTNPSAPLNPTVTYTITNGVEIFPGIAINNIRYGATFVAQVYGNDGTCGVLSASVNYEGSNPAPPSNTIVGGSWTLTITTKGKTGTICGKIVTPSIISWSGNITPTGTDVGHADMNLSVCGGTGNYKTTALASGFFDGHDNHVSGITIFGTTVPTVDGTLNLYK